MTQTPAVSFATCDLCDAHKNDSSGQFRVLPPVFSDFGAVQKFSGPVVTVKCFEDNSLVKAAVDSAGEGRVLVVDGGASLRRACAMWPSWRSARPAYGRWPPCRCRPKSARKASVISPSRFSRSGCVRATGCMQMKTASW